MNTFRKMLKGVTGSTISQEIFYGNVRNYSKELFNKVRRLSTTHLLYNIFHVLLMLLPIWKTGPNFKTEFQLKGVLSLNRGRNE